MKKRESPGPAARIPKISAFIWLVITGLALPGIASSATTGDHSFHWKDLIWPVINFSVLVIVIVLAGRKPIREYFRKRTETIEKSLKEAQKAREIAQKALDEVKDRINNIDGEIEQILDAARASGNREKDALVAEGERLKEKILQQTRSNIAFELQKAKEALKSEAALTAIELAEKQIKDRLGKKEQDGIIDEYIKKLEGRK